MMKLSPIVMFLFLACDSGGNGRLAVQLTDGPFPATAGCLDQAQVTVESIKVNGPDGWIDLVLEGDGPLTLDLLQLRSGIAADLAAGDLPTGAYTEIRLVISGATLIFSDGTSAGFKVPSGETSGIKIKPSPDILIAAGQTTPLLLDLDLSRSFHTTGEGGDPTCADLKDDKGTVIFRPSIRAINPDSSGVIAGVVRDSGGNAVADVEIAAFAAGTQVAADTEPLASTFSAPGGLSNAAPGSYAMHLDPGTFDLYARIQGADARAPVLTGVAIAAGQLLAGQDVLLP